MIRFRGELKRFSLLQTARAVTLLSASVGGAAIFNTSAGALNGLTLGYVLSVLLFVALDRRSLRPALRHFSRSELSTFASYGFAAAGSGTMHFMVPLALRWVGVHELGLEKSAGFALALDLMQRPFTVVIAAVQGVLYPPVVAEHEGRVPDRGRRALSHLYEMHAVGVLLTLGAGLAVIPELGWFFAQQAFRSDFTVAQPAALFFAFHAVIQNTISIAAHLARKVGRLVLNAIVEFLLVGAFAGIGLLTRPGDAVSLVGGAAVGSAIAVIWGLLTVRGAASSRPRLTVVAAAAMAALILWVLGLWTPINVFASLGLKVFCAALLATAVLLLARRPLP